MTVKSDIFSAARKAISQAPREGMGDIMHIDSVIRAVRAYCCGDPGQDHPSLWADLSQRKVRRMIATLRASTERRAELRRR